MDRPRASEPQYSLWLASDAGMRGLTALPWPGKTPRSDRANSGSPDHPFGQNRASQHHPVAAARRFGLACSFDLSGLQYVPGATGEFIRAVASTRGR